MGTHKQFFIYVYLDPRKPGEYKYGKYTFNYEPFYIGKGKNKRHMFHLNEAIRNDKLKKGNNLKFNKIKKIIETIGEPIIQKVVVDLYEQQAFDLEKELIKAIGRIDINTGPLVNLNDGGAGGENPSPRVKEAQRKGRLGYKRGIEDILKQKMNHADVSGEKNPRYGDHRSWEEIYGKEKADELKKQNGKRTAERCKLKVIIEDPEGNTYIPEEGYLKFCKKNNINAGLLRQTLDTCEPIKEGRKPRRGVGWIMYYIMENKMTEDNFWLIKFKEDPEGNEKTSMWREYNKDVAVRNFKKDKPEAIILEVKSANKYVKKEK